LNLERDIIFSVFNINYRQRIYQSIVSFFFFFFSLRKGYIDIEFLENGLIGTIMIAY